MWLWLIVRRVFVLVSLVMVIVVLIRQCIAAISVSVSTTTPSLLPAMKRALSWLSGGSAEQPANDATAWQRGKWKKKGKLRTSLAYLASVARGCKTAVHHSSASAEQPVHRPSASAGQPAKTLRPAEYMVGASLQPPGSCKDLTAPPDGYCAFYRLAFYDIGWKISSKERRHTMVNLGKEICDIVRDKGVDAVGISQVFDLRQVNHWQKRQGIMKHLLGGLNSSAAQPAWTGQCDGHYIFVWNSSRLMLKTAEYISCGLADDEWRMAQYLCFQRVDEQIGAPLHICHCNSPDYYNELNDQRRKTIFQTLWAHVLRNERDEAAASAVQPVAVFGGNYNSTYWNWATVLKQAKDTQASRHCVQLCRSKTIPRNRGDRAVVFNALALQEESGCGKSYKRHGKPDAFSDDHDVVLVPVCWRKPDPGQLIQRVLLDDAKDVGAHTMPPRAKAATQKAPTRKRKAHEASVSDAHPDPMGSFSESSFPPGQLIQRHFFSPARDDGADPTRKRKAHEALVSDAHPGRTLPIRCVSVGTPLWDNLVERIDMAATTADGQQFMKFLEEQCFLRDLCYKGDLYGDSLEEPVPHSVKMECLLETAAKRRKRVLERLRHSAAQPVFDMEHEIADKDMQNMYNDWRWDVNSWMNEEKRKIYNDLRWNRPEDASQFLKEAFDMYLLQLAGSKFLLDKVIQLPIIAQCNATPSDSAEQPASLMKCINELPVYMETDEYKASVRIAQKRTQDDRRLSEKIWKADWWLARGKEFSMRAQNGEDSQLQKWERKLANEYDDGKLERCLKDLLNQWTRRHRSFGASVQRSSTSSSAGQSAASSGSAVQTA